MNMCTRKTKRSRAWSLTAMLVVGLCSPGSFGCTGAWGTTVVPTERTQVSSPKAPVTLSLHPYRTRLRTVRVKVGPETGTFLLDTAGGLSQLTPTFAKKVGCEPW